MTLRQRRSMPLAQAKSASTAADAAKSAAQTDVARSDLDALAARIAPLESTVKTLADDIKHETATADDRAARLTVAAEALRAAVERGAPYQAELAAVKSLGADQNATAPLEAFAAAGVPRAAALAHELASLTPALQQAAEPASSDNSFLGRLENNARRLVGITPVDAPPGNDPASVVTRISVDAAHADIAAALTDIAALPDAAKPLAAAWVEKAQARNAAIAASRKLAADALAALCKPAAMIRVVVFLIVVGALALGVAWLADRPGDVVVTWQGLRIKTSLMVMAAALLVAVAVLVFVWSIVRAIVRSPVVLARRRRERRGVRAYEAISHGLIAVGSGDIDAARKLSADVNRLAPGEPLALLLERAVGAALRRPRRRRARVPRHGEPRRHQGARPARPVHRSAPPQRSRQARAPTPRKPRAPRRRSAGPAGRCSNRAAATATGPARWRCLERHRGALDKASYRRQRAVLLTARALAVEDYRPRHRQSARARSQSSSRRPWCRRRRSPAGSSPKAATCARPTASSTTPGAPIRIPNWRRAMPSCAPANPRATG